MTQAAIEAAARVLQRAIEAAAQDATFRAHLLADPRAALAERGLAIPHGMAVEVEEGESPDAEALVRRIGVDRVVLPLPPLRDAALSEAQLDAVVGGAGFREAALCYAIVPLAAARALVARGLVAASEPAADGEPGVTP